MIPGGPGGNHTLYEDIEDALFEYADIVIIDLRGCGYSNSSNVKYCTLEQNIKDLEFVRRSLGINKPIIHGCSYGAIVALGYCIKYPKSLMKLVLSSGAVSGDFIRSAQSNLLRRGTYEQIEFGNILWNGKFKNSDHFSEYYRIMSTLYFYNISSQKKLPSNKATIPYNIELVNFAFNTFLLKFDYQDFLHQINTPTLIFSGKNDWITDSKQAKILHKNIKSSIIIELDKCGHFPWKDQPDSFLKGFKNFLSLSK